MKYAADFRNIARDALRGKWGIAVIAGIIATLLGGTGNGGPEFNVEIEASQVEMSLDFAGQTIYQTGGGLDSPIGSFIAASAGYFLLASIVFALLYLFLGSVVGLGYSRFHLSMVDHERTSIDQLFGYFPHWKNAVCTRFLTGLYTFLWTLLFIIPGIIAGYSYSMTEYILAEHPEMTASEAIQASKEMMKGNKWRLFCLQISFIGWDILCIFTLGIGTLWLNPYRKAAIAAFYREISGTANTYSEEFEDAIPV